MSYAPIIHITAVIFYRDQRCAYIYIETLKSFHEGTVPCSLLIQQNYQNISETRIIEWNTWTIISPTFSFTFKVFFTILLRNIVKSMFVVVQVSYTVSNLHAELSEEYGLFYPLALDNRPVSYPRDVRIPFYTFGLLTCITPDLDSSVVKGWGHQIVHIESALWHEFTVQVLLHNIWTSSIPSLTAASSWVSHKVRAGQYIMFTLHE